MSNYTKKIAQICSYRKVLRLLFIGCILTYIALYWVRSSNNSQKSFRVFPKAAKNNVDNKLPLSSEELWTYKCEGKNCVRYHYLEPKNGEKRLPFTTCIKTCGEVKIWPFPTIKSIIGSESKTFLFQNVRLQINTHFDAVEMHIRKIFELFLGDLKRLQSASVEASEDTSSGHEDRPSYSDIEGKNVIEERSSGSDIDSFAVHLEIQKYPDLHLSLETDESYQLTIALVKSELQVHITANSFFGARHGLSTLQQLIWYDDEDKMLRVLTKALIVDAPKFRYRGLLLDTSRHFFSVEAIKRTIVGMSHAKLNRFHWHITDSQSFPYVSKYYPEMAAHGAYSDRETYSPEDVREVAAFANLHGVQVIPEIDAPAHAGNGWDWGPKRGLGELSLCINQQPWSLYCGEPPCGQLNPKNNNTYLILQRLYEELLNLTGPTDYFHLGGDEVNLDCWGQQFKQTDLYSLWCEFLYNALARLTIANKNVEPKLVAVWSSGLTNKPCLPNDKFAVQIWFGSKRAENHDLLRNGFNVIFSHVDAWYLDCGFGNWRSIDKGVCSPYRTWQTVYIHRPWTILNLDQNQQKQVLGGEVCLWTEQVNEHQLDSRLWPRSAALAERLWSDPVDKYEHDIVSQDVFTRLSVFRNRLLEYGIKAEPIFPRFCEQNPNKC